MIGGSAYQQPTQILSEVDKNIFDEKVIRSPFDVAEEMRPYLKEHFDKGETSSSNATYDRFISWFAWSKDLEAVSIQYYFIIILIFMMKL